MTPLNSYFRVSAFIEQLSSLPVLPSVLNPWRDYDPRYDASPCAPAIRCQQLKSYLLERIDRAKLILCAEALGFRGGRFTGIAMTSERILLDKQEKVPAHNVFIGQKTRTSLPKIFPQGSIEPTASIVWALMLELNVNPRDFLLWNSFPCHPHKTDEGLTNRPPTAFELKATEHVLPAFLALAPKARLVAVGRVAERALAALNMPYVGVRHPAMGGASAFRTRIPQLL